ncbi:MAG: phage tail protein [Bacteroidetes bacterium]|nr:phage tail protein [Bacteroidota bacterium]
MYESFIGSVVLFAGNFAPRGWAFCNGQLLSIAQNTALFSILGTTYGGDGQTTFALPDLRGRVPAGTGQGPGLSDLQLGETGGSESTALTIANMPMHSHPVMASNQFAGGDHPSGNYLGASASDNGFYDETANTNMAPGMIGTVGGSQPFDIRQPYLGLNYIICMEGVFPSRG